MKGNLQLDLGVSLPVKSRRDGQSMLETVAIHTARNSVFEHNALFANIAKNRQLALILRFYKWNNFIKYYKL